VAFGQGGPRAFLKHRPRELQEILSSGEAVALVDLDGSSNRLPNSGRGRGDAGSPSSRLMLGETTLGRYVERVTEALAGLTSSGLVNDKRVTLWGESFAEPNQSGARLGVPLELSQPRLAEPMGAHVALLCALLNKDVYAVRARGGLVGYRSLLSSPFVHVPYDVVVPGALTAGDLVDVVAALAPRKVTLEAMVDGLDRKTSLKEANKAYEVARKAYRDAKAEEALVIRD
jgi:hypothetical protein